MAVTMPPLFVSFLAQGGQMAFVLLAAPLFTGFVRKVKARLQRRRGASIMQPYRDLRRLIGKEAVVADNASWLFRTAPYLIFALIWVAASLVPTFASGLMFSWTGDLIAIIALLGAARFLLALAGLDIGTGFGGIGASREMMISSLAEPAMLMIVVTLALIVGSTQLATIAEFLRSGAAGLRVSLALALFALVIVALAENGRFPVDNPATHLELTMVHEAMVLEYSARHLAMLELAAWLKLLLTMSLIAAIFFPFGMAGGGDGAIDLGGFARGALAWGGKLVVAGALLGVFETAIAKMRVFRVPGLLGIALMLGLLGTLLLYVSRGL
jgi:formate hydrogenlyase subunit 4